MFLKVFGFTFTMSILLVPSVLAHELKIFSSRHSLPDGGGKATVFLSWGHRLPVDELLDSDPLDRFDWISPGKKITNLHKEGVSLHANNVEMKESGIHVFYSTRKPSIFTYILDENGERQLKKGSKLDHTNAKVEYATKYIQFAKSLAVVGKLENDSIKPMGFPFEITPLVGPSQWNSGNDIRFQILLHGKGVPFAELQARRVGFKPDDAWEYATESNRKGEFSIRPYHSGIWVIKANVKNIAQGKERTLYDFESYSATLVLEIQK